MPAILDGTGAGFRAKVNSLNQLKTSAVSEDAEAFATDLGDAYQIVSGRLTLTSDLPSAVLYVQNLDARNFVLDRVVLVCGTSRDGGGAIQDGDWGFQTQRNPTGGDIITNAIPAGVSNSNHSSAQTPNSINYRGDGTALTLTNGTGVTLPIRNSIAARQTFPLGRVLGQGSSIGWVVTAPPTNASADVVVVAHLYYQQG